MGAEVSYTWMDSPPSPPLFSCGSPAGQPSSASNIPAYICRAVPWFAHTIWGELSVPVAKHTADNVHLHRHVSTVCDCVYRR